MSDSDSDGYDIHDPRTREHEAYKISQENYGRARRRYLYGDAVDADGPNYDPRRSDNDDSMETRLVNAQEARYWALDEANRRYEWNGKWTGGVHEGVMNEADKRMRDVEYLNGEIEALRRQIDQRNWAHEHQANDEPESDLNSEGDEQEREVEGEDEDEEHSGAEYEKNVLDAREAREATHDLDTDSGEDEDGDEDEESAEEDEDDGDLDDGQIDDQDDNSHSSSDYDEYADYDDYGGEVEVDDDS